MTKPRSMGVTTRWAPGAVGSVSAVARTTSTPSSRSSLVSRSTLPSPSATTTTRWSSASNRARRPPTPCLPSPAAAPGPVCHPEAGTVSTRGPSGTESMAHTGASVWSSRRSQPVCRRGKAATSAPQVVANESANASSSACRSAMRSRRRLGSTTTTRASSSTRSKRTRSSPESHGSHDSIPSNNSPSARRSHCSRPHGCSATSSAARARTSSSGISSRHGWISTSARGTVARWSATPNSQSLSISSPHRSSLTGASAVEGQMSTIDPLTATSPRCSTWYSRR